MLTFSLTAEQAALWYAEELERSEGRSSPGLRRGRHVARLLELSGNLDPELFRSCWLRLTERHAALRTRFGDRLGEPYREILPEGRLDLTHSQIGPDSQATADAALRAEADRGFDLRTDPVLRVRVHSLGSERHRVLCVAHAAAVDQESLDALLAEFGELYSAGGYSAGEQAAGPAAEPTAVAVPEPAPELLDRLVAELPTRSTEPLIPPDLTPGSASDGGSAEVHRELPARLVDALGARCAEWGVTEDLFLATAFQTLLHLRSGETRSALALRSSGRSSERSPARDDHTARLVGCLAMHTAVGLSFADDPGFAELLARARSAAGRSAEGRGVPLATLVRHALRGRERGGPPPVQAGYLRAAPGPDVELAGLGVRLLPLSPGRRFDWELETAAEPGSLRLTLRHDPDHYGRETAAALLEHFEELVARLVAEPDLPVSRLPRAAARELHQLTAWQGTARDWTALPWVHQAFHARAVEHPDAVALRAEGESLGYGELDRRVSALAARLRGRGVGPGEIVGIAVERSFELVVSLLAVLSTGAAYLPLDPDYPGDRLAFMVADSGAGLVLAQPRLRDRLPGFEAPVLWLGDTGGDTGEDHPGAADRPLDDGVTPASPAYVIYTSGSTGLPKGTVVPHEGLRNRIAWMQEQYRLAPRDRVLQKTPSSFDVSVWEFFWPLTEGATLVLARPGGQRDMAYLADLVRVEGVTTLHFVPSVLRLFLAEPGVSACTSVSRLFCSGEALPPDLAEELFRRLSCELHNLYGPTEATVDVTWWPCRAGDATVPIGFPVANTAIHVLDRRGRPLPVGVPGEIHIGGVQLATAYLNRPRLTAERFVPDPFATVPGGRLYRTGDLGRRRGDGSVEYLGRLDHQLKLHGNRVEIGEIESFLCTHPAVRAAAVVAVVRGGATVLEAHVVPREGLRPTAEELTAHLETGLPRFMLPGRVSLLSELPLTPSGKTDRRALQQAAPADRHGRIPGRAGRAPRTPEERIVTLVAGRLLGRPDLDVQQDLFAAGADSLTLLRLRALLAAAGLELSPGQMVRRPTAEAMAEAARRTAEGTDIEALSEVTERRSGALVLHLATGGSDRATALAAMRGAAASVAARFDGVGAVVVPHPEGVTVRLAHPGFDRWSLRLLTADLLDAYRKAPAPAAEPAEPAGPAGPVGDTGTGDGTRERVTVAVPAEVRDGLLELAGSERVGLRTVLLAAQLRLASLLTGRTCVTVDAVAETRPVHVAAYGRIGAFSRLTRVPAEPGLGSWRELARRVDLAEQEPPTPTDTAEHNATDTASPLGPDFDVVFDYVGFSPYDGGGVGSSPRLLGWEETPAVPGARPTAPVAAFRFDPATGALDLVLHGGGGDGDDRGGGGAAAERRRLDRLAACFTQVLAAMAADPDGPAAVDLRPAEDRAVADAVNATCVDWSGRAVPGAHVRAQRAAESAPGSVAVRCGGRELSHAELHRRADGLARRLKASGLGAGAVVAVTDTLSVDLPVALLGVLRAGAAYTLVAPDADRPLPEQTRAVVLVGEDAHAVEGSGDAEGSGGSGAWAGSAVPVLAAHPAADLPGAATAKTPDVAAPDPVAPACTVPDAHGGAVAVSHDAIDNALLGLARQLNWQDGNEVLLVAHAPETACHGLDLLLALTTGARIELVSAEQFADPWELDDLLAASGATTALAAPDVWQALVADGWPGDPALRVLCAGGVLPADTASVLGRAGRAVWTVHGYPETGIWSLAARVRPEEDTVLAGLPLANTTCHVLGPDGLPTPCGVPGELHLGTPGVTPGRTLPRRLFPTGARARLRSDGVLEYLSTRIPESARR